MTQALKGLSCHDLVSRVKMFNKMKNNNGTMVLDKDTEDMVQINTPLAGVRDIVEMSLNLLTAVWRIPKIKYIGEGEGGLNASSKEQMRSFYDYILSQQEKVFTQPMEKVFKIFQLNAGKEINDAISFTYPSLVEMDDKERADLNKEQADRDAIYLSNGVLSQEEVRKRLSMDKNSEYSMIDVDDIPEVEANPLTDVDKVEKDETDRNAMDMALDFNEANVERKQGRFFKWLHNKDISPEQKIAKYSVQGTQIVDKNGEPVVVYHTKKKGEDKKWCFYCTEDSKIADSYKRNEEYETIVGYINAQNVIEFDFEGKSFNQYKDGRKTDEIVLDVLKEGKYDCIKFSNILDIGPRAIKDIGKLKPTTEYVIFDPLKFKGFKKQ